MPWSESRKASLSLRLPPLRPKRRRRPSRPPRRRPRWPPWRGTEGAAVTSGTGGAVGGFIAADLLIASGEVAAAGAVGFGVGTLINNFIIEPLTPAHYNLGDALCDLVDCDEPDFDVPAPPGDPLDDVSVRQVGSFDPNDLIGPEGVGAEHFVPADATLPYTIHFENLAAATAPAQTVTVTQQLDPDLDLSTFEFVDFGLGAGFVEIPAGLSSFAARYDLRAQLGVLLDVDFRLNVETGLVTWQFTSLDPTTLELPADPLTGFLPPNQGPPEGEGSVSYIVRPKQGLATGTRIDAQASVVFDTNPPIDTPAAFNTLDAGDPTSAVDPLPATVASSFPLTWSGGDEPGGSGIARFDVFVSEDGGPFLPFLTDTTQTSANFIGQVGHTYGFFSVGTDNVGHRQPTPTIAQAQTTVSGVATTTSLSSSLNPSNLGDSVTFTATVSLVLSGVVTPTGTVQFLIDGTTLGAPVALVNGISTSPAITSLAVGLHDVTASFFDASGYYPSSQGTLDGGQRVNAPTSLTATTTTLVPSSTSPIYGQSLDLHRDCYPDLRKRNAYRYRSVYHRRCRFRSRSRPEWRRRDQHIHRLSWSGRSQRLGNLLRRRDLLNKHGRSHHNDGCQGTAHDLSRR